MNEFLTTTVGWIIIGFGFICLLGLLALLMAFPTMWLWNALMPELFGLKVITLS